MPTKPGTKGATDAKIDQFIKQCDFIVQECDDLRIKVLVQTSCQKFGILLVMATLLNGMIVVLVLKN